MMRSGWTAKEREEKKVDENELDEPNVQP